ncbi:YaaC family protein [Maribacter sp. 2210JD10-5]|uniref:YaaC family protein n=1 Tax=Maribacter sp. 2210JD10-5 TaxID=3386272 RepID=UPI0039BD4AF9
MTQIEDELGEQVRRDFKAVKYFPFKNDSGAPFILTSDPFSYLQAWLDNKINRIKRDRGKQRSLLIKAKYFAELSEGFHNSSQQAKMPSKGTLIYYTFINLVKTFLLVKGYDLETKMEHHGLSLPSDKKLQLKLTTIGNEGISIFHEFAKTIGIEINNGDGLEIKFDEILRELPEVHEIGYALNLFPGTKRKHLPIDITIRTNKNRNRIYYTIAYEKKFDKIMKTDKLLKGVFKQKIYPIDCNADSGKKYFRSKLIFNYTCNSDISHRRAYKRICADILPLRINQLITRNGYRSYLNLEPSRMHRLSATLAFGYYIGTVARYRPTLNNEILKGKYQALVQEAVSSCPNQFFYLLVSHITNQICAIPMAKIE